MRLSRRLDKIQRYRPLGRPAFRCQERSSRSAAWFAGHTTRASANRGVLADLAVAITPKAYVRVTPIAHAATPLGAGSGSSGLPA